MEGPERPERDRPRGYDRPRRDDRRHRSRSRSPAVAGRDDYTRRRSRSPRRRSPSPHRRPRSHSRPASPADRRDRDRDGDRRERGKRRDSRSRSPSRERRRERDRDGDGERRRRSQSRSSSSSSDSEDERERRYKRKKDKHRKRSHSRDRDRKEKKKKSRKDKKVRAARCCFRVDVGRANAPGSVVQKHKSGGAVGHHQWGKYGIINESECVSSLGLDGYFPSSSGVSDGYMRCSLYNKEQEFRAWLVEERKINPETITKDQTKKEFARFTEDYNTGECSGYVTVCLKAGSSWWCQR